MYVIVRDDGKYVAPPGEEKSYTSKLEEAWTFADRAKAEAQRCQENERVVAVSVLLRQPKP